MIYFMLIKRVNAKSQRHRSKFHFNVRKEALADRNDFYDQMADLFGLIIVPTLCL